MEQAKTPGIGPHPLRELLEKLRKKKISYGEFKWYVYQWLLSAINWNHLVWIPYEGDIASKGQDMAGWTKRTIGRRVLWRNEMESRAHTLLELESALQWGVNNGHKVQAPLEKIEDLLNKFPITDGALDLSLGPIGEPEIKTDGNFEPWLIQIGPNDAEKERLAKDKPVPLPDIAFPG